MAERTTGFTIVIKGSEEQQKKLGLLTGQLARLTAERQKTAKAVKAAGGLNAALNQRLAQQTLRQKELRAGISRTTKSIQAQGQQQKKTGGLFSIINKQIVNSFKGVGAAIGLAFGARAIAGVIGGAIKIFKNFQQAQADLASVLGKTRDEITALTEDAKRLGSQTVFTATEVSKLQKEFAKLGFSEQEILSATEATLQLAAATNSDLAQAAEVAGKTIRAFGLDASDTQRVVDVMAKSFSSSALDLGKFQAAMANVAPVAKTAGFTIERTTAILGTLVDSGIEASKAGTDLRKIFISLSNKGITLEDSLEQIRNSTDKNKTAFKLFGQRAFASGVILAGSADKAELLEQKLNNAGGAAKRMADEQLDTLTGELTLLNSAWEGFILSLEDGSGTIQKLIRDLVGFARAAIVGAQTLGTRIELLGAGLKSLIGITTELSKDALQNILSFGLTEAGNKVSDLLKGIEDLGKAEIKSGEATRNFVKLLEAEGESREASIQLVNFALNQKLKEIKVIEAAAEATKEANKDKLDSEKELTTEELAELEKRAKKAEAIAKRRAEAELKVRQQAVRDLKKLQEDQFAEALRLAETQDERDLVAIGKQIVKEMELEIKALIDQEADIEVIKNKRIELQEARFNQELVAIGDSNEEKKLAELEHKEELDEIDIEFREKKKERDEEDAAFIKEQEAFALQSFQEGLGLLSQISDLERNKEIKKVIKNAKREEKILDDQLAKGIISQQEFDDLSEQLREKADAKILAAEKKSFATEKVLSLIQVAINTAQNISKAAAVFAFPSPPGIVAVATASALGLAQAAIIAAKKFHVGGRTPGQFDGRDNIPALLSGDETILTPDQRDRLGGIAAMKAAGVPGFQDGGRANVLPSQGALPPLAAFTGAQGGGFITMEEAIELVSEGINSIEVGVLESEITGTQKRVAVIEAD